MKKLPHLRFDSSQSATIRFAGPIASIAVHWAEGSKTAQVKLVCPNSATDDGDAWAKKYKCKYCEKNNGSELDPYPRTIGVGYDWKEDRWCVYMGHHKTFEKVMSLCAARGIPMPEVQKGNGPDVIIQRIGMKTEVALIPSDKPLPSEPPGMGEVLEGLASMSVWRTFDSQKALVDANTPMNGSGAGTSVDWSSSSLPSLGFSGYHGPIGVVGGGGGAGQITSGYVGNWETPVDPDEDDEDMVVDEEMAALLASIANASVSSKGHPKPKPKPKEEPPLDDDGPDASSLYAEERWDFLF